MTGRKDYRAIEKEDYQEPRCVLCDPNTGLPAGNTRLPMQRITEKLDAYCDRKDFAAAERHLQYWLEEARYQKDKRGEFSVRNEMMGFYRKQGNKDAAIENAEACLQLSRELSFGDTESGATCYINCGTVYDQFGMPEKAVSFFLKAREIFLRLSRPDAYKLGGLYNNMALAYAGLSQFDEAMECFENALAVMETVQNGEPEQAITYLNMADARAMEKGLEEAAPEIAEWLERARELLDTDAVQRDGYYAFVCEKCAPGFYCYGWAEYAETLVKRAENIYAALQ